MKSLALFQEKHEKAFNFEDFFFLPLAYLEDLHKKRMPDNCREINGFWHDECVIYLTQTLSQDGGQRLL